MDYLVRLRLGKAHTVAHHVHQVNGVTGALCSTSPKPAEGDESLSGRWEVLYALPKGVRICQVCAKMKQRLDNPLPPKVEKELEMLARWDPRAAERQREKMIATYRSKLRSRR